MRTTSLAIALFMCDVMQSKDGGYSSAVTYYDYDMSMMNERFTIRLAGVDIGVRPMHSYIYKYCRDYVSAGNPAFTVAATQDDLDAERAKSEAEDKLEGIPVRQFSDAYLEILAVYRKIAGELLNRDVLLFHGSCIAVDGNAYLFTAKSGTGKSTHVKLWREKFGADAVVINDDKPLLAIRSDRVIAYGTPWDGKHRISTNTSAPLKAICILTRSETNQIRKITAKEAYPLILQQTYRPDDSLALIKTLKLVDKMLARTEIYLLGCNMDKTAAEVSYAGMNGGNEQ